MRYEYTGQHTLQVVEINGPPLLGQDWLEEIHLDWASIRTLSVDPSPAELKHLEKYSQVFQPGLGTMKHVRI